MHSRKALKIRLEVNFTSVENWKKGSIFFFSFQCTEVVLWNQKSVLNKSLNDKRNSKCYNQNHCYCTGCIWELRGKPVTTSSPPSMNILSLWTSVSPFEFYILAPCLLQTSDIVRTIWLLLKSPRMHSAQWNLQPVLEQSPEAVSEISNQHIFSSNEHIMKIYC